MKALVSFIFCFIFFAALAQKPVIDAIAIEQWEQVRGTPGISSKGTYVFYDVVNQVTGKNRMVLQKVDHAWSRVFEGEYSGGRSFFTTDEQCFLFTDRKKVLRLLNLAQDSLYTLPEIQDWKFMKSKSGDFLVYPKGGDTVVVHSLTDKTDRFWSGFTFAHKNEYSSYLVVKKENEQSYYLLHPETGEMKLLIAGVYIDYFIFDKEGKWVTFSSIDSTVYKNQQHVRCVWLYDLKKGKVAKVLDDRSGILRGELRINGVKSFTDDGGGVYLELKSEEKKAFVKADASLSLCIWNSFDSAPPIFKKYEAQPAVENREKLSNALFVVSSNRLVQLDGDSLSSLQLANDYWLLKRVTRKGEERSFVSGKTGVEQPLLNLNIRDWWAILLSPSARYLVYYDPMEKNYMRYDIGAGTVINLTKSLNIGWVQKSDVPKGIDGWAKHTGWLEGSDNLIVNDYNDLWLLDVSGGGKHKNLTGGLGAREDIFFTMEKTGSDVVIPARDKYLLYAFNRKSKKNAFYEISLSGGKTPALSLLSEWNFSFYTPGSANHDAAGFHPIKAENVSVYLLKGMSARDAPNYFTTVDFRSFNRVSDVFPEKKYNWLSSELITWTLPNGKEGQGILYKPENFDSTQKYPVIINYYEKHSDDLFAFLAPALNAGDIDVGWFVSRGYLVFRPDIDYEIGYPGRSAFISVNSGVDRIVTLPYVDSGRMGICGHSFGGFETNYLITHSDRFAAAISAAGPTNMTSLYGSTWRKVGGSMYDFVEQSQVRMGYSLADRPDLYLENSPVLLAKNVKTPLLLMHSVDDNSVPFAQGVEFFTALKRCGKKVWFLQYDRAGHTIGDRALCEDYTKRSTEFFDYYLKEGRKMPCWMKGTSSLQSKVGCDE